MRHASAAAGVLCGSMLLVAACDTPIETEGFDSRPIAFSIVSGNGQTGAAGAELAEPLVVRVTRPAGNATVPVSRFLVNFRVMMGGGSIFAGSVLTDVNGIAQDYWTLGPTPGMNILEVRSVDPSTGEKHVHGRFTATGIVPGPELCNGIDDDLDGITDDPGWPYCVRGVAAANTDGTRTCWAGYFDLNTEPVDGCEILINGRWTLTPTLTLSCPWLPTPLPNTATLSGVQLSVQSTMELAVSLDVEFGFMQLREWLIVPVRVAPRSEIFSGSHPFSFDDISLPQSMSASGDGTASLNGMFTSSTSFQAVLHLELNLTIDAPLVGEVSGTCAPVDAAVVGSRVST